jgi:hypothetical protein
MRQPGYVLNSVSENVTLISSLIPPSDLCCYFRPTCGLAHANGSAYNCNTSAGSVADPAKTDDIDPSEEACCQAFVATCATALIDGTPYRCPIIGVYVSINPDSPVVNDIMCCQFVATCGVAYRNGASYRCPEGYRSRAQPGTGSPDLNTCCAPDIITADTLCLNASLSHLNLTSMDGCPNVDGQCCYESTCGSVLTFNESSFAVAGLAPYECPAGMVRNSSTDNVQNISAEACGCVAATCGHYYSNGDPFNCSDGYISIPEMFNSSAVEGVNTCCVSTLYFGWNFSHMLHAQAQLMYQ